MRFIINYLNLKFFGLLNKSKLISPYIHYKSIRKSKYTTVNSRTYVDNMTKIGNYSYIGMNCKITSASIGNYCSIADNVTIGPGEHDLSKISTSAAFYSNPYNELTQKNTIIESDVWIGVNSTIKRGVTLQKGSVVGAHSFVTNDVPPYAIVVGSPAKILRYRFPSEIITLLISSNWTDCPLEKAKDIHKKLNDQL